MMWLYMWCYDVTDFFVTINETSLHVNCMSKLCNTV